MATCPRCHGSGQDYLGPPRNRSSTGCPRCGGFGQVPDGEIRQTSPGHRIANFFKFGCGLILALFIIFALQDLTLPSFGELWPFSKSKASILVKSEIPGTPYSGSSSVFFDATYSATFNGGSVVLAGSANGSAPFGVDDAIQVTVTRPDGTQRDIFHDFSANCSSPLINVSGMELTDLLQDGINFIEVQLVNRCTPNIGNGDLYLVADDSSLARVPAGLAAPSANPATSEQGAPVTKLPPTVQARRETGADRLQLAPGSGVDLDSLAANWDVQRNGGVPPLNSDLFLPPDGTVLRADPVSPVTGATADWTTCSKATAYYTDIGLRNVTPPRSYCLKTSESRTAFVTVLDTDGSVSLDVTVWDPPSPS